MPGVCGGVLVVKRGGGEEGLTSPAAGGKGCGANVSS